jgi:hypothetical protein
MPKRTNQFQRLIRHIQSHLDPGSSVNESVMLVDAQTGIEREVDIVVAGKQSGHDFVVALECRDHKRMGDVKWIDEMIGKYIHLPVNRLVLVAHKPFSKNARKKAEANSITLYSLKDIDAQSPERLFPYAESLYAKAWTVEIETVTIHVPAEGDLPAEHFKAVSDTALFLKDRSLEVNEFVNWLLWQPHVFQYIFDNGTVEHKYLQTGMNNPVFGVPLCVQKLAPSPVFRRIERIDIIAKCTITAEEFPLKHGEYNAMRVAWGEGKMLGRPMMLVASERSGQMTYSVAPTRPWTESPSPTVASMFAVGRKGPGTL